MARRPTGAITQVDPGVYKDASGGYFTGTSLDNAQYQGNSYKGGGVFGQSSASDNSDPSSAFQQPQQQPTSDQPIDDGIGGTFGTAPGSGGTQGITDPQVKSATPPAAQPWSGASGFQNGAWPGGGSFDTNGNWVSPSSTSTPTNNNADWIGQTLQEVQSTDDPNYWRQQIANDPKVQAGDQSAIDYWKNRIRQGDGSMLVRNGTLKLFQDGPNGTNTTTTQAGPGFQGTTTTPNTTPGQGTGFADPAYQKLIELATQRINNLGQPQSFPQLDQLTSMLKQNQDQARQRAQTFATQMQGRIEQLQKPLLSDADVANQNAQASNNLLAQRDATLANQKERRFAQGFEPTSGLLAGDERTTNEQYNNRQAQIDASLRQAAIQGDEQRRNHAAQLQALVQQALQGGDVTALGEQAQVSDLENQMYNLDQNRQREALTTANIPVDLTNQGFQNANTAANSGGNALQSILSVLGSAGTQQGMLQNAQNGNMSALMQILQLALKPSTGV